MSRPKAHPAQKAQPFTAKSHPKLKILKIKLKLKLEI
jgi:hypothetical protein